MKTSLIVLITAFAGTAQATLIDRGGGLIYDDVLNITWLQDANYSATDNLGFATVAGGGFNDQRDAVAWADAIIFADWDDWRLPGTPSPHLPR